MDFTRYMTCKRERVSIDNIPLDALQLINLDKVYKVNDMFIINCAEYIPHPELLLLMILFPNIKGIILENYDFSYKFADCIISCETDEPYLKCQYRRLKKNIEDDGKLVDVNIKKPSLKNCLSLQYCNRLKFKFPDINYTSALLCNNIRKKICETNHINKFTLDGIDVMTGEMYLN